MSYRALYRTWRPQKFNEIIGQEHIVRTLCNALQAGIIAHAYLFSGPRGTGKTSTAKVLARAVNCLRPQGVEPCGECQNCISISDGSSMDVLEIDAASNRGIDEIRALREKVGFAPTNGRYRVYIIDEVHMLTGEAFNALLKTLEEPPSFVIFVLATTEAHKVPLTIMSRCQRFDFRRIPAAVLVERLRFIAEKSNIIAAEEALWLIARAAEGGMRDALSLLDQVAAFTGGKVTAADVRQLMGMVGGDVVESLTRYLLGGEAAGALRLTAELVQSGKDLRLIARDLLSFWRLILRSRLGVLDPSELAAEEYHRIEKWAAEININRLIRLFTLFNRAEQEMRWSALPVAVLEIAIIKGAWEEPSAEQAGILWEKVNWLEQKIEELAGGARREVSVKAAGEEKTVAPEARVEEESRPGEQEQLTTVQQEETVQLGEEKLLGFGRSPIIETVTEGVVEDREITGTGRPTRGRKRKKAEDAAKAESTKRTKRAEHWPEPEGEKEKKDKDFLKTGMMPKVTETNDTAIKESEIRVEDETGERATETIQEAEGNIAGKEDAAEKREEKNQRDERLNTLQVRWRDVMTALKNEAPSLYHSLQRSRAWPLKLENNVLFLAFPSSAAHFIYLFELNENNQQALVKAVERVCGFTVKLKVMVSDEQPPSFVFTEELSIEEVGSLFAAIPVEGPSEDI